MVSEVRRGGAGRVQREPERHRGEGGPEAESERVQLEHAAIPISTIACARSRRQRESRRLQSSLRARKDEDVLGGDARAIQLRNLLARRHLGIKPLTPLLPSGLHLGE